MGGVGDCGAVGGYDGKDITPCIVGVMAHPMGFLLAGGGVLSGKEDAFDITLGVNGIVVLRKACTTIIYYGNRKNYPMP